MKKIYRFSSLLFLLPVIGVITTSCYNRKPIIGYGYLKTLELVNNPDFTQPSGLPEPSVGTALIISDVPNQKWSILDNTYQRFDTIEWLIGGDPRYLDTFTFSDWLQLMMQLDITIHFKQSDFDEKTWTWLDEPGKYSVNSQETNPLNTIFNPRTPAHFRYGFDVYHEINQEQGVDPARNADQLWFYASSNTFDYSQSTSSLNQYLTLNITQIDDGVDWTLSWVAPLVSFQNWGWGINMNLLNFEFKLFTTDIDVSQIITPYGDVIGFKYETPPQCEYFTIINDYFGKHWN